MSEFVAKCSLRIGFQTWVNSSKSSVCTKTIPNFCVHLISYYIAIKRLVGRIKWSFCHYFVDPKASHVWLFQSCKCIVYEVWNMLKTMFSQFSHSFTWHYVQEKQKTVKVVFISIQFYSISSNFIQFHPIPFNSIQFHSLENHFICFKL